MNQEKLVRIAAFLLRIVAGLIFLQNGGLKLFGWFGMMHGQLPTLMLVAGIIETVGGALIILGLFTRPAAFISSGEMAFAYFMGHVSHAGHWYAPLVNQGQPAVLLCFVFLFFAAYGGGMWSLDAKLFKHKA